MGRQHPGSTQDLARPLTHVARAYTDATTQLATIGMQLRVIYPLLVTKAKWKSEVGWGGISILTMNAVRQS